MLYNLFSIDRSYFQQLSPWYTNLKQKIWITRGIKCELEILYKLWIGLKGGQQKFHCWVQKRFMNKNTLISPPILPPFDLHNLWMLYKAPTSINFDLSQRRPTLAQTTMLTADTLLLLIKVNLGLLVYSSEPVSRLKTNNRISSCLEISCWVDTIILKLILLVWKTIYIGLEVENWNGDRRFFQEAKGFDL